jgi:hypothetical protein
MDQINLQEAIMFLQLFPVIASAMAVSLAFCLSI